MPGSRAYDFMYRTGLAGRFWSRADRWEIRDLIERGPCSPALLMPPGGDRARALDIGCGAGGVSIYLARYGFETVGVDFSATALRKARRAASAAGLSPSQLGFVQGDLTAPAIPGVEGPFDLLVDYGTLDDLKPDGRHQAARLIDSLARPGSRLFIFAFYGRRADLPLFSLSGPSRLAPELIEAGGIEELFGGTWDVERVPRKGDRFIATFLLTRR